MLAFFEPAFTSDSFSGSTRTKTQLCPWRKTFLIFATSPLIFR